MDNSDMDRASHAGADETATSTIFAKAKAEFSLLKRDNSVLRRDIDEMQTLFSTIMQQLDQLETQPRRLKSRVMMDAYQRRQRRNVESLERTYVVEEESPIVTAPRSGGCSLNTTTCTDGYGRFEPAMCSTYVNSANTTMADRLDTSLGSLADYSLVATQSDTELQPSQVRGILKQSSVDLSVLTSPRSTPRRRRRRTRVRFAEASDSENECSCNDCSKSKPVVQWDDSAELLLDDVCSSALTSSSQQSSAEEDVDFVQNESSSNTLNATDVTISPMGNENNNNTEQELTSFATDVLFPSPWLPNRRVNNGENLFDHIEREYEKCCQQMKFDVSQYSTNLDELRITEEQFIEKHCPDHEVHEALGETCSLLIDGSLSLLQNSTLEMERGSESGFESTQTTLDSSVDSNHTDVSSITSAYDMRRSKTPSTVIKVRIEQALPASLEATRGSTPDMTNVTTPETHEKQTTGSASNLPTMAEMNFQIDETPLTGIPESVLSPCSSDRSHSTVFQSSPASSTMTSCPELVPIEELLDTPLAPQNSPLASTAASSPQVIAPPGSPLDALPDTPEAPDAPARQTRRFPAVPQSFARRLDFQTPAKDLKRRNSLAKRLGNALARTPRKRTNDEEAQSTDAESSEKVTTYKRRKNLKKRLKQFSNFFHKKDNKESDNHVVETLAHF